MKGEMDENPILPKYQMSEEDIKLQYITSSITPKCIGTK